MHAIWRLSIRLALLVVFLACCALWAASAAANYHFGLQYCGDDNIMAYVCGGASVSSDVIKTAIVFALIIAWRQRHWLSMMACTVVAVVTIAFSLISAASFYTWMTADVLSERELSVETTNSRVTEMKALHEALAAARTAAIKATYRKDREAAALLAQDLQQRIDWLRADISITTDAGGADPTAELVKQLGLSQEGLPIVRLITFVALLELGSAFSLTAFSQLFSHGVPLRPGTGPGPKTRAPTPRRRLAVVPDIPDGIRASERNSLQVAAFLQYAIREEGFGAEIDIDDLRAMYEDWCVCARQPILNRPTMGRHLSALGVTQSRKGASRRTYILPASLPKASLKVVA